MGNIPQEDVLVVPRSLFERAGVFQGFCADTAAYLPLLLDRQHTSWRPRASVEEDPSFKQLIPYCVLTWSNADGPPLFFAYTRGGGQSEARLRAKRSVGIGGHIASTDGEHGDDASYESGMLRELAEEVAIDGSYAARCVGHTRCAGLRITGISASRYSTADWRMRCRGDLSRQSLHNAAGSPRA